MNGARVARMRGWARFAPRRLAGDSLLRNSFFLFLNLAAQAAIGFVFWLLCARLFATDQVGTATTMIAGSLCISLVSLLGVDSTFVRHLPTSRDRDEQITVGVAVVFVAALAGAGLYVVMVAWAVPGLRVLQASIGVAVGFIVLTAFTAVNIVTDSVFVAYRKTQYNVLVNGVIQGLIKLVLPFFLVGLGAYGIFMASGLAATVAMAASLLLLGRVVGYRPRMRSPGRALGRAWSYSLANYATNLLVQSPALIIPLVVLHALGPDEAAFYYVSYQVAALLFAAGWAVSLSFFAEGSYDDANLTCLIRRSARALALVSVPGGIAVAVAGHWILLAFGPAYSAGGTVTLAVLALSAPAVALCSTAMTVLRIRRRLRGLMVTGALYASVTVVLAAEGAPHGLQWVAVAYLVGTTTAGLAAAGLAAKSLTTARGRPERPPDNPLAGSARIDPEHRERGA
jgi:O-antigen/teichoic acid export membrane protein